MTTFAMLLVPDMTQLDFTGPYEVFVRCPNAKVELVWKRKEPVRSEFGLTIEATASFESLKEADVLFIPGGRGMNALLNDAETLDWIRQIASSAKYLTSACTGALVLGAAGLLVGKRATTHWTALEMLSEFGAIPTKSRTVQDGNILTGGGVTAGIDFALKLAEVMHGKDLAQTIQLNIEYNPDPPFKAGHPDTAPAHITQAFIEKTQARKRERLLLVKQAAQRLRETR